MKKEREKEGVGWKEGGRERERENREKTEGRQGGDGEVERKRKKGPIVGMMKKAKRRKRKFLKFSNPNYTKVFL